VFIEILQSEPGPYVVGHCVSELLLSAIWIGIKDVWRKDEEFSEGRELGNISTNIVVPTEGDGLDDELVDDGGKIDVFVTTGLWFASSNLLVVSSSSSSGSHVVVPTEGDGLDDELTDDGGNIDVFVTTGFWFASSNLLVDSSSSSSGSHAAPNGGRSTGRRSPH